MRKYFLVLTLLLVLISGCFTVNTLNTPANSVDTTITISSLNTMTTKATKVLAENTPSQINKNIKDYAPCLAKAISMNPDIKKLISSIASRKITGENEVLYDMLENQTARNVNKLSDVRTIVNDLNPGVDTKRLVENIPFLNIYIHRFDLFDSYKGPLYVLPLQYTEDGSELNSFIAYDKDGKTKVFNTSETPDFPVVVIGISEKIDRLYYKLNKPTYTNTNPQTLATKAIGDGSTSHDERLKGIKLNVTLDSWPFGEPELYVLYVIGDGDQGGQGIKQPYDLVDKTGTWYDFDNIIFSYADYPQNMFYKLEMWESDWNWWFNITYTVLGSFTWEVGGTPTTFNIKYEFKPVNNITAADDSFGNTQVRFYHPLNSSGYTEYYVGNAYIRLGY